MKKLTLIPTILVLILLSNKSKAQISLSANDIYSKGTFKMSVDTSRTSKIGNPGADMIWDFTKLQSHLPFSIKIAPYFDPTIDANLIEIENTDTNFVIKKTNSQISFVILEKNLQMYNFPMNYLSKLSDSITMKYSTYPGLMFGYPLLDSVRLIYVISSTSLTDAWGTLKLPNGNFEALRLKNTMSVFSYWEGKKGNGAYYKVSEIEDKESSINYYWYSKNKGYYLAKYNLDDEEMSYMLSGILSQKMVENMRAKDLQVSNPFTNQIIIKNKGTEPHTFMLFDVFGKKCLSGQISADETILLESSHLTSGIYNLQITNLNNHSVSYKKILK